MWNNDVVSKWHDKFDIRMISVHTSGVNPDRTWDSSLTQSRQPSTLPQGNEYFFLYSPKFTTVLCFSELYDL